MQQDEQPDPFAAFDTAGGIGTVRDPYPVFAQLRVETTVALNALLDRLPDLRLDPAETDVHVGGLTFRAPRTLPVLFG